MTVPVFNFQNTYTVLPAAMYSRLAPTRVASPSLVLFNMPLAHELGLNLGDVGPDSLAAIFSGNMLPQGAEPLAQAYSGHQFGHYTILGDGRAIVLGEHIDPAGRRADVQLKGSGPTPYSRRGDGRATLISMLREYLISEAIHALGIPGSRSLAVVTTGEQVVRERLHQGAVLTRVASSHIRVGTFEFARHKLPQDQQQQLVSYVIERHYPELLHAGNPALALLRAVADRQATLLAHWMRVGFIHGVMNTDNTSMAGETFDYGPCAFMNTYDPHTVFSSIDQFGRYAFGNQPHIIHWNLAMLAGALLALIDPSQDKALEMAKEVLDDFPALYETKWLHMMCAKLGLANPNAANKQLAEQLLAWMHDRRADYTNTFLELENTITKGFTTSHPHWNDGAFRDWHKSWEQYRQEDGMQATDSLALMQAHNPAVIPRNHLVEEALQAAAFDNNMAPLENLKAVLAKPYIRDHVPGSFQAPPPDGDRYYKTYCGT